MPRRQSLRKRKNGGGNTCTGARKKSLTKLLEEETATAKQGLDEIRTAVKVLDNFESNQSLTADEIEKYNLVLNKINRNFKDGIDGESDLTKMYSINKTPDFTRLCNRFRTTLLSYLKEEFLRILLYPNNKKYKLSEREIACITEEEKKKITDRALILKKKNELTESEKLERENAVKTRLAEQRAFIIKSDYDETISKLKYYSKQIVIPSYKEWVQIIEDANIEKPNFKQWLLDQNKITAFDASFMEKIENITREYSRNTTKTRYKRAPTMEEWIKINEYAERSSNPQPILNDEWLINNDIQKYKTVNPTSADKTIVKTFGKTQRRVKPLNNIFSSKTT